MLPCVEPLAEMATSPVSISLPHRSRLLRLAVLVVLGLGIWSAVRLLPRKQLSVRVTRSVMGPVRDVVTSSTAGEVSPQKHATLRAELTGRVVAVQAERGDRMKKGVLVVALDPADFEARLRQSQASLEASVAQRAQSQIRLKTLRRQAERAQLLADRGAGPVQVSEDANASVAEAEIALRAADGQRAQAEAAVQVARVQRARADLLAPFDGLITEVNVNVGDSMTPGAPVFEIVDDSRLHVDATVDEADAARVRLGQVAALRLDALPGRAFAGKVTRVDPVVKRDLKGARTLTVEVEVAAAEAAQAAGLKPGMSANVDIIVAEKLDVLSVPSNVIVGRGVNRFVYVLRSDPRGYRVFRQPVDVGLANWERSEIRSGLAPDAMLVMSLNEKGLDDGVLVQPIIVPPEPATGAR